MFDPAGSSTTRLWQLSETYTLPAASAATPAMAASTLLSHRSRPVNGSAVWVFDPAASFNTRWVWVSAT
ncbi:Uncharacterised protein [Mycobacterium tuberculosis]|nr:Uncharacterised protein [Mycobacterium tuberculosis]